MSSSAARDLICGDPLTRHERRTRHDQQRNADEDGAGSLPAALVTRALEGAVHLCAPLLVVITLTVWLLAYVPVLAVGALGLGLLTWRAGAPGLEAGLAGTAATAAVSVLAAPGLVLRVVEDRLARFGRRFLHRWRWDTAMLAAGLYTQHPGRPLRAPRLIRIRLATTLDTFDVYLCPGIPADEFTAATDTIRQVLRLDDIQVLPHPARGWLRLGVVPRGLTNTGPT